VGENKEYFTRSDEKGSVNISEDVICIIAAAAMRDVPGVDGAPNTLSEDIAGLLGKKSASRGVKIRIEEEAIKVDAYIMVRFGYVISDVAREVQNAIINSIEATTGLSVPEVNVHVCGITFDKEK